jgi:UDP-N-acetylmuramate: L-alanyl-gamma-D-glutamyl-meso-diaminopimelate ligase
VQWDVAGSVASLGSRAHVSTDIDDLVTKLDSTLRSGDHVLMMSNGGFGGVHAKLLTRLTARSRQ